MKAIILTLVTIALVSLVIGFVMGLVLVSGCATHKSIQRSTEPDRGTDSVVEQRMSPAMIEVVSRLVYLRSDPNVWQVKEIDPFRKRQ